MGLESSRLRRSATDRLHRDHVLGTRLGKLDQLQQRLLHGVECFDAGAERQQDDVEPVEDERQPQRQEDQQEPDDCPQDTRAQAVSAATFSFTHRLPTAASRPCSCQ